MSSASAAYHPLPTDDPPSYDDTTSSLPLAKPERRRVPAIKLFLYSLAVCALVGFFWIVPAYKDFIRGAEDFLKQQKTRPDSIDVVQNETNSATSVPPDMSDRGKYSVGYFVNWGIYGRKFPPSLIPVEDLTHILYAFANVRADSGEVFLSDLWADQDIHYPGDPWDSDPTPQLYGNFGQLYKLKQQHRHLKVILSIGGWTYSPSFHPVVVDAAKRAKFVESAIALLEDYALDGLDVDYEYPQNDAQARGYVALLQELRRALDAHASHKGADYRFLLTIAAPCGPDNYEKLHAREMDEALDFWNMMSYDFAGSWDKTAGHQANVYGSAPNEISADRAIQWYLSQGIARHKIIMGVPLYGRSFMNTAGPGKPFTGIGPGSWENGVYDYRALPLPGSTLHHDERARAAWSYDRAKGEMISFDDERVGRWKGEYIQEMGLGGAMFWELSGDKSTEGRSREGMEGGEGKEEREGRSLVHVLRETMGRMDAQANWLKYEGSRFGNIAGGKGGDGGSKQPAPPGGGGGSVAPWSASAVYTGGTSCTHAGYVWTAKWWTQGEEPRPGVDVWAQGAPI